MTFLLDIRQNEEGIDRYQLKLDFVIKMFDLIKKQPCS